MPSDRSHLHKLVDEVPPDDLQAVEKVLRTFAEATDPVLKALLLAKPDTEPLTRHEREAIAEFEAACARGEQFPAVHPDRLLQEFGSKDTSQ